MSVLYNYLILTIGSFVSWYFSYLWEEKWSKNSVLIGDSMKKFKKCFEKINSVVYLWKIDNNLVSKYRKTGFFKRMWFWGAEYYTAVDLFTFSHSSWSRYRRNEVVCPYRLVRCRGLAYFFGTWTLSVPALFVEKTPRPPTLNSADILVKYQLTQMYRFISGLLSLLTFTLVPVPHCPDSCCFPIILMWLFFFAEIFYNLLLSSF